MKVVLASKNRHKLEEISKITEKFDIELVLQSELGIGYGTSAQIAQNCDIIFLGVKPHMMRDCLLPLQSALQEKKPMLVTMFKSRGCCLHQKETTPFGVVSFLLWFYR
jgi:pyrroline-5-carboxylate reductase